jgi:N4-gp56 family major capsid protein
MIFVLLNKSRVATDLMQTTEWIEANKHVDTTNLVEGVLGELYGIYFLEYDLANKVAGAGAGGVDVYQNFFIGKGAYGVPDIQGSSKPQIIVHPAGSAGGADPLNQFNTVAWKSAFATIRLNELCIARYECTATV